MVCRVTAILLAAGLSRRMGSENKLLKKLVNEQAMVRNAAEVLLQSNVEDVTVIVGHEMRRVCAALVELPVEFVLNPHYRDGQATSVNAGMKKIQSRVVGGREVDAVLVALSDQPLLEASDISGLIEAYSKTDRTKIMTPFWQGERGNPIVIPIGLCNEISASSRKIGCRNFIENNPNIVTTYEAPNENFVRDIDTVCAFNELTRCRPSLDDGQDEILY